MSLFPWDNPDNKPIGQNERYQLWLDKSSTKFAQSENSSGVSLRGWYVAFLLDLKTREAETRILYNEKNEPVDDSQSLEGIGVKIDIHKMMKQ